MILRLSRSITVHLSADQVCVLMRKEDRNIRNKKNIVYFPRTRNIWHYILWLFYESAKIHRLFSFAAIVDVPKLPFKGAGLSDLSQ